MSDKSELPNNERMKGVLAKTFKGLHHAPKIKKHSNTHWEVNAHGGLSSFDNDSLTRLVIAAHDYAVRVEIKSSGPGLVKVCLWCRKRTGDGMERHPSIEEVLADLQLANANGETLREDKERFQENSRGFSGLCAK